MCKRCDEIEIEMQAADEYGFTLTLAEYKAELDALQKKHAAQQGGQEKSNIHTHKAEWSLNNGGTKPR